MLCANCGISLNENDKFCYNCGKSVTIKPVENNNQNVQYNTQALQNEKVKPVVNVQETKRCKLAITSFILSFVLVIGSIPSIIFSILSLKKIKKSNLTGRGLAISGLIISCVVLFFFILIFTFYHIFSKPGDASLNGGITLLFK